MKRGVRSAAFRPYPVPRKRAEARTPNILTMWACGSSPLHSAEVLRRPRRACSARDLPFCPARALARARAHSFLPWPSSQEGSTSTSKAEKRGFRDSCGYLQQLVFTLWGTSPPDPLGFIALEARAAPWEDSGETALGESSPAALARKAINPGGLGAKPPSSLCRD